MYTLSHTGAGQLGQTCIQFAAVGYVHKYTIHTVVLLHVRSC